MRRRVLSLLAVAALILVAAACDPTGVTPPTGTPGADGSCTSTSTAFANPVTPAQQVTIFEPQGTAAALEGGGTCGDAHRPVIFFAHGFGGTDPADYQSLINHLVSRGFIVVYAAYPSNVLWNVMYATVDGGFTASVSHSTRMDLTNIGFMGHSLGGGMTPWLVQQAATRSGWGTHSEFVVMIAPWFADQVGTGAIAFPAKVHALVINMEQDQVVDNRVGIDLYKAINLPTGQKTIRLVLSDAAESLTAQHLTVNAVASTQLDTWGIWRPADAEADCVETGTNCDLVANTDMGTAADGTAITRAISDKAPVDANPPLSGTTGWDCDRPLNPRPCDPFPSESVLRDLTIATGSSTAALPFTIGDDVTAATALTVHATSSNTTLVPASGIVLGGSGTTHTVTVTPATGKTGLTIITVTVTDADGHTSARHFVLDVS